MFRDLAGQGRKAFQEGDYETAADCHGRALGHWQGPPLTGLRAGAAVQAEVTGLEDLRLSIAEQHAQACIELGRSESVISDLRALLAEHPLQEELWALFMVALHRCGRQADALAVFPQARRLLTTELGIEPGERLQQAHQEILARQPAADTPPTTTEAIAWRQLPMDIAEFAGRTAELTRISVLAGRSTPTAVTIMVIQGMAGVGKTRLAVHAAHQIVHNGRFAEIQLWADLRGFDAGHAPADPAAVLENFLRLLGVAGDLIPQGIEARAALYRDRLVSKQALILLDNAADEAQVRPLLPGAPGSLVLVTSRRALATLDGVHAIPLDVLPQDDAITLLAGIAGDGRFEADPAASAKTAQLCGHLPIALSLAARRLRSRPAWTVNDLVDRLPAADHHLQAVFGLSYNALPPRQRQTFRLLGLHPGDDFTADSTAALTATTPNRAELVLEALLDEHLLQQTTTGRYRFHDLLRRYAREKADTAEARTAPDAAVGRLLTWYLHTAESARCVFDPHRMRIIDLPPLPADCHAMDFPGYDQALAWFTAERTNLSAVVHMAAAYGLVAVAWKLAWVLLSFYYRRSHWDDWITTFRVALDAARANGERRGEGIIWRGLGVAYSDLRQLDTAVDCHKQAQTILEEVGDRHGQAWNLNNLGVAYVDLDQLTDAASCFHRALPIFLDTHDPQGEGLCLNNLGDTYRRSGQPGQAVEYLKRALVVQKSMDDRAGLQFTLGSLGDLYHDAGEHRDALPYYQDALATSRTVSDRRTVARALDRLARTLDATGDRTTARAHWQEALAIFADLGDSQAQTIQQLLGADRQ